MCQYPGHWQSDLENKVKTHSSQSKHLMQTQIWKEGKGYIAVPAWGGSLAEAKRACNQTSPI
eukprot:1141749-Pelagomonas_calceolata.AAC.2